MKKIKKKKNYFKNKLKDNNKKCKHKKEFMFFNLQES